jgi:hypothetical protein
MAQTPPNTQYEIVEHLIDLTSRAPFTPMKLPLGWVPLTAERRSGRVVVLLTRQIGPVATLLPADE